MSTPSEPGTPPPCPWPDGGHAVTCDWREHVAAHQHGLTIGATEPDPAPTSLPHRFGTVRLETMDGRRVVDIASLVIAGMLANGKPPEMLLWGTRTFYNAAGPDGPPRYVEGLMYVVLPTDTAIT